MLLTHGSPRDGLPRVRPSKPFGFEGRIEWRRGDSKPKSPFTENIQQPYRNDTKSSQVQTVTDLTNQATEQILTDSIQNHNTTLHKKYAICMHQNNITPESLPADLTQIVTVWPDLPKHIKTTIITLVETASDKPSRTARKGKG
jgi:hypothetical protein